MNRRRPALFLLALATFAPAGHAGHGLMNAFADLRPLPPPGLTAADLLWPLERLAEAAAQAFAATPALRQMRALACARERLAELVALAPRDTPGALARTLSAHAASLADAGAAGGHGQRERRRLALALARDLLEQHYLLAVSYLELPAQARPPLARAVADIHARYTALRAGLPPGLADSLFFAEEEVRWEWEMAERGDAQGM